MQAAAVVAAVESGAKTRGCGGEAGGDLPPVSQVPLALLPAGCRAAATHRYTSQTRRTDAPAQHRFGALSSEENA